MPTDLTDTERRIVLGLARDTAALLQLAARWGKDPLTRPDPRTRSGLHQIMAVKDAQTIGLRLDLAGWLGRWGGDDAARQAAHRALVRLEATGLIEWHAAWGERLTHARLTNAGRAAAAAALANEFAAS